MPGEVFHRSGGESWHKLPRDVVSAPTLEAFKAGLDGTLGNPSCWVALPKVESWIFEVLSNPNSSMNLRTSPDCYPHFCSQTDLLPGGDTGGAIF